MTYGEFAKIYDKLIFEDIDYEKICVRINELIKIHNGGNTDYLDLACGTGNVGIKMAENFKNVYAVDLSEEMLGETYDKFRKIRKPCKIICQDMTELSLNHSFDVITCVLDSTNYIVEDGDLEAYFSCVYSHLKEGGLFIFDINSFYKLTNILGNNIYTYSTEEVFYTWENTLEDNIVDMFLTFFVRQGDLYERFEEEHQERAYTEEEIEETLKKCGFTILNKYNGYSEEPVTENSERIMYIIKK